MATVSILVPVYNTAQWLAEMVRSVQSQTFQDWELVAIDDGSKDNSWEVLQELAKDEPRMRILSRGNKGVVETRNELLSLARGDFICWHDSDDTMTARRLQLQLDRFSVEPGLVWVGGAYTVTDPDGLPIKTFTFPAEHEAICKGMEEEISCCFGSTLMRRETIRKVGGFRHPFVISEDFDLCLRMSEVGRVANIPEVVLLYRQHMASTVNNDRPKSYIYSRLVRELAAERRARGTDRLQRGEPVTLNFENLPTPKQNRADTHRRWAWWALTDGYISTARKYALRAVREAPLERESWKVMACALRGR